MAKRCALYLFYFFDFSTGFVVPAAVSFTLIVALFNPFLPVLVLRRSTGTGRVAPMGTITSRKRRDGTVGHTAQIRLKRGGKVIHTEAKTFDRRPAAAAWLKKREG